MKNLFDVHTHYHENLGNHRFVLCGYNKKTNEQVIKYSEEHNCLFSLGLAPQDIQREELYPDLESAIKEIQLQIDDVKNNSNFAAIGEVGLDKHWGKSEEQLHKQFVAFENMVSVAKKYNKPLVIHSRKTELDCIKLLSANSCKKVLMHSFGGNLDEAKLCSDLGWLISINPYKSKEKKKILKELDISNFVIESDAPYIAKKSSDSLESAKLIAKYKDMKLEAVLDATYSNACKFFGV